MKLLPGQQKRIHYPPGERKGEQLLSHGSYVEVVKVHTRVIEVRKLHGIQARPDANTHLVSPSYLK